jgi:hypothetical protein
MTDAEQALCRAIRKADKDPWISLCGVKVEEEEVAPPKTTEHRGCSHEHGRHQ